MDVLALDGSSLGLADVVRVARRGQPVALAPEARARMAASRAWVEAAARGELVDESGAALLVYGVNTGYGSLARHHLQPIQLVQLSGNLVRSHAAGVGRPVPPEVVRGMMLLRANALAKGASGCQPALVETLCAMLVAGVVPEIPSQGSCGSSGDLAPLAHLAIVVFEGREGDPDSGFAWFAGRRMPGAAAMAAAGIPQVFPGPKDGLAMCNGVQLTTSFAALACEDAAELVQMAEVAAAMSWEALRGVTRSLTPEVHALRPYPGVRATAASLARLMAGSSLVDSLPDKVQDAYSLRCTPEVLGAVRDALRYVRGQIRVELNAATDNPLVLLDIAGPNKAVSAGLFHGEPVGLACDHLKLAMCELGALSERRTFRLTTGSLSARLPPGLVREDRPGMGWMIPQTTAAALVSENRSLAWPSTADSLPTCEDQEDLVAMSTTAARRATEVVANARNIVAIELLGAARALWFRQEAEPAIRFGVGTAAALDAIEALLGGRTPVASPSDEIARVSGAIAHGTLLDAVRAVVPLTGVDDA